jgi:hypothetical protein
MPQVAIPVLASSSGGSVLTMVLPLGVLIAVIVWYVWLWLHGAGER